MDETKVEYIRKALEALTDTSTEVDLSSLDIVIECAKGSAEGQVFLGEKGACKILTEILSCPRNKSEDEAYLLLMAIRYMMRRGLAKHTSNYKNIELFGELGLLEALAKTFKEHIESSKVTESSCWCIMILASDNEDNQVAMANAGVADTLLDGLNRFATNEDIIEILCRALRNMSSNMSIAAYFVSEGISDPITGTIVIHTENPAQLEAALWVVVNLTYNSDIASILGGSGICVAVTDVLRANFQHSGVVFAACWAIRNLSCGSVFNFGQFVHTEVCPSLLRVVHENTDDLVIVSTALWAIANLACDVSMSARMGSEEASVQTVMDAVRRQVIGGASSEEGQEVVEAGVWAIQNLASGGKPCRVHLLAHGVVEIIVVCLSRPDLLSVKGIRETVCGGTLTNLLCEDDSVREELQSGLKDAQLGDLLCDILRQEQFMAMPSTAYAVCKGLRGFAASSPENAQTLEARGACGLATRAMGLHRDIPDVVSSACDVLLAVHYSQRTDELERLKEIGRKEDEEAETAAAAEVKSSQEAQAKAEVADTPPPPPAAEVTSSQEAQAKAEVADTPPPPPDAGNTTEDGTSAECDEVAKKEGEFEPESVESITAKMREALLGAGAAKSPEDQGSSLVPPHMLQPERVSKRAIDLCGRVVSKPFEEMVCIWAPQEVRETNGWTLLDAPEARGESSTSGSG